MLLEKFNQYFKTNFSLLFNDDVKLIVAVSGGMDSVVLCDLLFQNNIKFVMAHCNFNLRNDESERDELFVKELAKKYNTECFIKQFETEKYALENKLSIQLAARKLRYDWFAELQQLTVDCQQLTNKNLHNFLATAHHKNDNIETVLFNFFRGSGIKGLTGIKELDVERKLIRPLIHFGKEELKEYAITNQIKWVEDSSNQTNKYTRNSFRSEIIPSIKKHFEHAEENIYTNIQRLNEVEELYQQAINFHKNNLIEIKNNEIKISILKLKKIKPLHSIVYEMMKDYGFTALQTNDVVALLEADNGSYVKSNSYRIIVNRNWLLIAPLKNENAKTFIIEKEDSKVAIEEKYFTISKLLSTSNELKDNIKSSSQKCVEYIDSKLLSFPLIIRKCKTGDYFYPLGLSKKQKLSRFFINKKLSTIQKENVWVVESNKKIVWVIGYRIDDRFKIKEDTKSVFRFEMN